jgi:hypothetical protein
MESRFPAGNTGKLHHIESSFNRFDAGGMAFARNTAGTLAPEVQK